MKIIGIALIAISIICFGFIKTNASKKRPSELDLFIDILSVYKSNLVWEHKSISQVLSEFQSEKYNQYLESVRINMQSNDFYGAFLSNEEFKKFHLIDSDIKVLGNFFNNLGKYGIDEEIRLCEKSLDFLLIQKNQAEQERERQGKLYFKLGLLFALWVIILLV